MSWWSGRGGRLRAAIAAHQAGSEVVVLGKRRRDDAHTVLTAGGINAARTVEAFSSRMHEEMDLDSLTAELLAVTDQTMEPTMASLWLRPSAQAPWQETHRGLSPGPLTAVPGRNDANQGRLADCGGLGRCAVVRSHPGRGLGRTMPGGPSHLDPGALEAGRPCFAGRGGRRLPLCVDLAAASADRAGLGRDHRPGALPAWYAGVEEARELAPGTPRASAAGSAM